MTLYRLIGIQFEENMLIGFRGNKYQGYQEKGSTLIPLARLIVTLELPASRSRTSEQGGSENSQSSKDEYVVVVGSLLYN